MAALEWRIISELMRSKNMAVAQRLGFTKEHLRGDMEAAQAFEFIRQWYYSPDTPREFPTLSLMKRQFPSFKMLKSSETDSGNLSTLMKECKSLVIDSDVRSLVRHFAELVDDDPREAVQVMRSKLARVSYDNQTFQGFSIKEIAEDMEAHRNGALSGTIYGIPWPWELLTADTLGKNPEDFIVMYGRMKSMKTWILLKCAMDDFLIHKRRVLIWSREMNRKKMALRAGSILGGVDYQTLKDGSLPWPLYEQAIASMRMMGEIHDNSQAFLRKMKNPGFEGYQDVADLLVVSGRGAPMTLEGLGNVVEAFGPDVMYLDSMYHLDCEESSRFSKETERQRALAVATKQRAIDWTLPIVATVQGNRDSEKNHGETLGDIGWTDSLAQEADLIMRILYSDGPEPFEDAYEGYWEKVKQRMTDAEKNRAQRTAGLRRIPMNSKAQEKFSRSRVPKKVQTKIDNPRVDRLPHKVRASAELFLMMGGNREGTLRGFSINVIPGYQWDVSRENVTPKEAKKILDEKNGPSVREGGHSKKSADKNRSVDPSTIGNTFSSLT